MNRALTLFRDHAVGIYAREQKILEPRVLLHGLVRETGQPFGKSAYVFERFDAGQLYLSSRVLNEVGREMVENTFERLVELQLGKTFWMRARYGLVVGPKKPNLCTDLINIDNSRLKSVIELGGVVGDFVDQVDQLRFERRTLVKEVLRKFRKFRGRIVARVFDDSFAHLECQIQAGKIQVALFELLDDPQRMQIMVEALAELTHACIKLLFAGMSKRRMADVVNERKRFGQVRIHIERARHGPGNLSDLKRVRKPVPKMIGEAGGENLRFRFEAPEGARVNHTVAITRVVVSVSMLRFRVAPSLRTPHVHGIGCGRHRRRLN